MQDISEDIKAPGSERGLISNYNTINTIGIVVYTGYIKIKYVTEWKKLLFTQFFHSSVGKTGFSPMGGPVFLSKSEVICDVQRKEDHFLYILFDHRG